MGVELGKNIMGSNTFFYLQVLPDLFHTLRTCEDGLKEFITWKLGTLVSIVRQVNSYNTESCALFHSVLLGTILEHLLDLVGKFQHIRKYLPELLSLISELWSSFSLPPANRPLHGSPVRVASFGENYLYFILQIDYFALLCYW